MDLGRELLVGCLFCEDETRLMWSSLDSGFFLRVPSSLLRIFYLRFSCPFISSLFLVDEGGRLGFF
jgi:hypothetical protein